MGAQHIEENPAPATLAFLIGDQRVNVIVVKDRALTQAEIIDAILRLGSLAATSNQLYFAAPRLLGAMIDAQLFRSFGIGLLLYDDRRIDEAVPPGTLQIAQSQPTPSTNDLPTVRQMTELKSMYLEIKSSVAKLREDLNLLGQKSNEPLRAPIEIMHPAISPTTPLRDENSVQHAGPLPSFFDNNPWLDVLSKRGRDPGEPIAG
jgi:hypothetical protein